MKMTGYEAAENGLMLPLEYRGIENPAVPLSELSLSEMGGMGSLSESDIVVTHEKALMVAPVWQAVTLLSGDVAKLPFVLYRRTDNGRVKAIEHPAFQLARMKSDEELVAFQFWRQMMFYYLLFGNAYAFISRDLSGNPISMTPMMPDRTRPLRVHGVLSFVSNADGRDVLLEKDDVLHLRGLSLDNVIGMDNVRMAKELIGQALGTQRFSSKFFANGATSSGILEIPGKLSPAEKDDVRDRFQKDYTKASNAFRVVVLQGGVKYIPTMVTPKDAEMSTLYTEWRIQVASFYNLPPHKLGDSSRVSYNSLEQENQGYLDSSLMPHLVMISSECWDKLLTQEEKDNNSHYFEHSTNALVRADIKTRFETYRLGKEIGILSTNEIRSKENMPPVDPADGGDTYYVPANWVQADSNQLLDSVLPVANSALSQRSARDVVALRNLAKETVGKMFRRIGKQLRDNRKDKQTITRCLGTLAEKNRDVIERNLAPVLDCCRDCFEVRSSGDAADIIITKTRDLVMFNINNEDSESIPVAIERVCAMLESSSGECVLDILKEKETTDVSRN